MIQVQIEDCEFGRNITQFNDMHLRSLLHVPVLHFLYCHLWHSSQLTASCLAFSIQSCRSCYATLHLCSVTGTTTLDRECLSWSDSCLTLNTVVCHFDFRKGWRKFSIFI